VVTRKHYVAIAAALAATRPIPNGRDIHAPAHFVQWLCDRGVIIGVLAADNPRFDPARFIKATEA